jgi:hypothetical protein
MQDSQRRSKARKFNGMIYAVVQASNTKKREALSREDWQFLKDNNYKNVGWQDVIRLYQAIEAFFQRHQLDDLSLGDLFLEVDRIGNKYLSSQEVADFNNKLAAEVAAIAEKIDQQFPDTESEVIDFSSKIDMRSTKKRKFHPVGERNFREKVL